MLVLDLLVSEAPALEGALDELAIDIEAVVVRQVKRKVLQPPARIVLHFRPERRLQDHTPQTQSSAAASITREQPHPAPQQHSE
jgi:hypothetical protein